MSQNYEEHENTWVHIYHDTMSKRFVSKRSGEASCLDMYIYYVPIKVCTRRHQL